MTSSTAQLLRELPADLDWAVVFRLEPLRQFPDELLRAAFTLSATQDLDELSHVALTSAGPQFVTLDGLLRPVDPARSVAPVAGASLADRFADRLHLVPAAADCIGVGADPPRAPALLHATFSDAHARAIAVLDEEPATIDYRWLRAVGVSFVGGGWSAGRYLACFEIELTRHLFAALQAGFGRTAHCNLFFLNGCLIDETIGAGLRTAAADTVGRAAAVLPTLLAARLSSAVPLQITMTCIPPGGGPPSPYGDVVPAGLARLALATDHADATVRRARRMIDDHLVSCRQGLLWSFHRGGLATATDTVLVALAAPDSATVEALEAFRSDEGYLPQLAGPQESRQSMPHMPGTRHWEQPDLVTSCLVRHLQFVVGRPVRTTVAQLEAHFADRAGMFIANPFLVDWAFSLALRDDPDAGKLRQRLADDVIAAAGKDGGFGHYDQGLSTALAILTLAQCGYGGDLLRLAQLRLVDLLDGESSITGNVPFCSSVRLDPADIPPRAPFPTGVVRVGAEVYAITYYRDDSGAIGAALMARALAVDPARGTPIDHTPGATAHPRYCHSCEQYLRQHALPRYTPRRPDKAEGPF